MSLIPKIGLFAYNQEAKARAIAANTVQATGVAEIAMIGASEPVCWLVLPEKVLKMLTDGHEG